MSLIQYLNYKLERVRVFKDQLAITDVLEYIRDEVSTLLKKFDDMQLDRERLIAENEFLKNQVSGLEAQLQGADQSSASSIADIQRLENLAAENEMLRSHLVSQGVILMSRRTERAV